MTVQIDVWSDFACPWCYLVGISLKQLQTTHDVNIIWHSFELRPKGSAPMSPMRRASIERMRPKFRAMAKERYNVDINPGPSGVDSRMALIGEKYAEEQGKGKAYHDVVTQAYWSEAQDISDLATLKTLAESVGLDGGDFMNALADMRYDTLVDEDVYRGHQNGIHSVPTLIFDNKYLVSGAQSLEALQEVVEKAQAEAQEA